MSETSVSLIARLAERTTALSIHCALKKLHYRGVDAGTFDWLIGGSCVSAGYRVKSLLLNDLVRQ
jgi:hypothetical protein